MRDTVGDALAAEEPLEIVAGGTKRGLGRPLQLPRTLDLSRLAGIRDYEPSELVLTAGAATRLAEIDAALAAAGQMLAFEPPDWRALYGLPPEAAAARWGASSPATSPDRGGSRPVPRATIFSAFARSAAAAKSSNRAAGWSKTSPATIYRN